MDYELIETEAKRARENQAAANAEMSDISAHIAERESRLKTLEALSRAEQSKAEMLEQHVPKPMQSPMTQSIPGADVPSPYRG
jgi:hypothetical protein